MNTINKVKKKCMFDQSIQKVKPHQIDSIQQHICFTDCQQKFQQQQMLNDNQHKFPVVKIIEKHSEIINKISQEKTQNKQNTHIDFSNKKNELDIITNQLIQNDIRDVIKKLRKLYLYSMLYDKQKNQYMEQNKSIDQMFSIEQTEIIKDEDIQQKLILNKSDLTKEISLNSLSYSKNQKIIQPLILVNKIIRYQLNQKIIRLTQLYQLIINQTTFYVLNKKHNFNICKCRFSNDLTTFYYLIQKDDQLYKNKLNLEKIGIKVIDQPKISKQYKIISKCSFILLFQNLKLVLIGKSRSAKRDYIQAINKIQFYKKL